ncbi:DEAD/DEAH box helicase, partial [Butyricicoccus sp. 1XD8-22]
PDKLLPGISPFIYGKYMLKNVVNVRLKDVWPDPVELVDTPTIMVPMSDELTKLYNGMINTFQSHINSADNPGPIYRVMMDYGIAYPDNPFTMPDALLKMPEGDRAVLWNAEHLNEDITLPKEQKLQEIITTEMSEGRKSIVYVRDTGSTNPDRDVRPRLKKKLEEIGAKVCILDTTSADTDKRSQWLENKIVNENYDVCIVSQELVKVGLDLLCTPSLIFYQFSWSLFTINQAAKRAWRIGQTEECRLFYLAYEGSMQEHMAKIIAMKNKATAAINGEVSSTGLSAMLGDEGDLRSLLLKSIKEGGKTLKGSSEDWISKTTDRAREILAGIGKKKAPAAKPLVEQLAAWSVQNGLSALLRDYYQPLIQVIVRGEVKGFEVENGVLMVDLERALGQYHHTAMVGEYLMSHVQPKQTVIAEEVVSTQEIAPKEETPIVVTTEIPEAPVVKPSSQLKQSEVKQNTEKQSVRTEQELASKIVVLKDVQKQPKGKSKSNRRQVTSENQLVLDLFA